MARSNQSWTVAVTGATGFVGRYIVRELLARGYGVRALLRDRAKGASVLPRPTPDDPSGASLEHVFGDVLDRAALRDLCAGCSAVIHTIGIRRELPPTITFDRLHPRATRAVTEAALAAGADRFIHISALGTRAGAASAYHRSKYESECCVRASGLRWTILRPSMIHGPDGEFIQMVKGWALGREMPFVFIPYFTRPVLPIGFGPPAFESARVQPVSVGDVAFAAVESLQRDEAVGEVYPLGGPSQMDWPTMLGTVRDALPLADHSKRIVGIPGHAAMVNAIGAAAVGMGPMLPFGPSEPVMAMEDSVCSNEKARADLGFEPSDFTASVRGYAARI